MKNIPIFLRQLWQSIKSNGSTYLLFFLVLSVTISGILYFFVSAKTHDAEQMQYNENTQVVTVGLESNPSQDQILKIAETKEFPFENILFYGQLDAASEEADAPVIYAEFTSTNRMVYGEGITPQSTQSQADVVVVPTAYKNAHPGEDSVTLNGKTYQITGEWNTPRNAFWLPYSTLLKDRFRLDQMLIQLHSPFTQKELDSVRTVVENAGISFSNIQVPEYDMELQNSMQFSVLMTAGVYFIAVINFAYLYFYLLQKRRHTYAIYRTVGMSKQKAVLYLAAEVILLFTLSYIAGALLAQFGMIDLLAKLLDLSVMALSVKDALFLYLVMLIPTLAVMLVAIFRFLHVPAVQELKESEGV